MMLITLEKAKADLQMDHDQDDADITDKVSQASAAVMNYLGRPLNYYEDSTGEIPADEDGEPNVPFEVRAATTLMVRFLYHGDANEPKEWHYLPTPVVSLLYPLRVPTIG